MPQQSPPRPWWLAGLVIGAGVVCIWGAASLPPASRYAGIGAGAFPTMIGGALVFFGLLLALSILRGEQFIPQDTESADASQPMNPLAFALALAGSALPILTIKTFGLPLTAMASFVLIARAFGSQRLLADLVAGAALGSLSWVLFDYLGLQLGGFLPFAGF